MKVLYQETAVTLDNVDPDSLNLKESKTQIELKPEKTKEPVTLVTIGFLIELAIVYFSENYDVFLVESFSSYFDPRLFARFLGEEMLLLLSWAIWEKVKFLTKFDILDKLAQRNLIYQGRYLFGNMLPHGLMVAMPCHILALAVYGYFDLRAMFLYNSAQGKKNKSYTNHFLREITASLFIAFSILVCYLPFSIPIIATVAIRVFLFSNQAKYPMALETILTISFQNLSFLTYLLAYMLPSFYLFVEVIMKNRFNEKVGLAVMREIDLKTYFTKTRLQEMQHEQIVYHMKLISHPFFEFIGFLFQFQLLFQSSITAVADPMSKHNDSPYHYYYYIYYDLLFGINYSYAFLFFFFAFLLSNEQTNYHLSTVYFYQFILSALAFSIPGYMEIFSLLVCVLSCPGMREFLVLTQF